MLQAILIGNAAAVRSLLVAKASHNQLLPETEHSAEGSPLSVAMETEHPSIIRLLLDENTVNQRDADSGATPLYAALQMNADVAVDTLLEMKADPNLCVADGSAPAELAVFTGMKSQLEKLLEHKIDPSHARARDGNSLLMMAAFKGEFEMARMLTDAGADVHHANNDGHTVRDILSSVHKKHPFEVNLPDDEALMVGAENDDVPLLQAAVKSGTDLGERNEDGLTALGLASYFGSVNSVDVLIEAKSDPNTSGDDGSTPLMLAVFEGNADVVKRLTTGYGPALDQTVPLAQNTTALYLACQENRVDMVKLLLEHSVEALEIQRDDGVSPLYVAAHEGHTDCVALLLSAKANVNLCNGSGTSPLYIAVQKNFNDVARLLLDAGAHVNSKSKTGSTPVMVAAFHCNTNLVSVLLSHGASVDDQAGDGSTAAMLAAKSLDVDVACQLLVHGASLNVRNRAGDSVDDLLRTKHGVTTLDVAFHSVARHAELEKISSAEAKDMALINTFFDKLDTDGSETISREELESALDSWGMKTKYGDGFRAFVSTEFDRLDEDGDGEISFPEFEACYSRFHLLYRSSALVAQQTGGDVAELLHAEFEETVPAWIRTKSIAATATIWGAFSKDAVLERVVVPEGWRNYVVDRVDAGGPSQSSLLALMGFDVEEVKGWAAAPADGGAVVEPVAGTKYLRVSAVDRDVIRPRSDNIEVGDVLMSFFGNTDDKMLRGRRAFTRMCRQVPFCFLWVYRAP